MRRLLAAVALPLAACGSDGTEGQPGSRVSRAVPIRTQDVPAPERRPAKPGFSIEPGRWATRFEVAGAAASDESVEQKVTRCVSEAEARRPPAMLAGEGDGCRSAGMIVRDGRMAGTLVCPRPGGGRMTMRVAGGYTPETYDLEIDAELAAPGLADGRKRVRMRTSGRRVGVCAPI